MGPAPAVFGPENGAEGAVDFSIVLRYNKRWKPGKLNVRDSLTVWKGALFYEF